MTAPVGDSGFRLRPVGDAAVIIDLADAPHARTGGLPAESAALPGDRALAAVLACTDALRGADLPGVVDIVPAAETLLVVFASADVLRAQRGALGSACETALTDPGAARPQGARVEIPVVYDGEDLTAAADAAGMSAEALIELHASTEWVAAFGGFAPGFAYCVPAAGADVPEIPRRSEPRTAVPAGSVALAGRYSAVYPRRSPGGWQLIGHTETLMWDETREHPALLSPGDRVRYVPVRAGSAPATAPAAQATAGEDATAERSPDAETAPNAESASGAAPSRPVLEVLDPGLLALVEDAGRPGRAGEGVSPSGAADRASAAEAARLVGDDASSAVVETIGGLSVRALADVAVGVSGAAASLRIERAPQSDPLTLLTDPDAESEPLVEEIAVRSGAHALLRAGDRLTVVPAPRGLRAYLAVRGGIAAETVLGSAATDVLSGLGPAPLAAGDVIAARTDTRPGPVGLPGAAAPVAAEAGEKRTASAESADAVVLRAVAGPRDDWFAADGLDALEHTVWEVGARSNRTGIRLAPAGRDDSPPAGTPQTDAGLTRTRTDELASEGMVAGAIQVPPSGEPVLFLADHPVTGGYPVIAVVVRDDLDRAGQLAPGDRIRISLSDADRG